MSLLASALSVLHDLPAHLTIWSQAYGAWIYALLFGIIFSETGFVVAPFLPGDSLLFAVGALTALDGGLSLTVCLALLTAAAILGNLVNYAIGSILSTRLASMQDSRLFNRQYLERTQGFYARHGGKTIVITRFMPIIRTYAPFVAGLGRMNYMRFSFFNVVGAVLWIFSFTLAGHYFGNLPEVKANFQYIIIAIVVVSALPAVFEFARARAQTAKAKGAKA